MITNETKKQEKIQQETKKIKQRKYETKNIVCYKKKMEENI